MIKRYSDHAANERTFLAWVRTAIAVMAFGFVIERFDLFLQVMAPQLALKQAAPHGQTFANMAGLAFIGIGAFYVHTANWSPLIPARRSRSASATCTTPSQSAPPATAARAAWVLPWP